MSFIKNLFKTKIDIIVYAYIFISVILHILYNISFKDSNLIYSKFYVDTPFYTINNILVLFFELLSKIINIGFFESVLNFTTKFNDEIFSIFTSVPYLGTLITSLDWTIMYVLFFLLSLLLIVKKLFSFTIKTSLVVAVIYLLYTFTYQYTLSNKYQDMDYISSEYYANCECEEVKVKKVVDGDTIRIELDGKEESVRLLYIDTPEATKEIEPFGYEATNMLKAILNDASIVNIEYDNEKRDKYGRVLAWVWADGVLVQEIMTKNGLVEDFYDYGNYKYEDIVITAMDYAINNNIKIYK